MNGLFMDFQFLATNEFEVSVGVLLFYFDFPRISSNHIFQVGACFRLVRCLWIKILVRAKGWILDFQLLATNKLRICFDFWYFFWIFSVASIALEFQVDGQFRSCRWSQGKISVGMKALISYFRLIAVIKFNDFVFNYSIFLAFGFSSRRPILISQSNLR